MQEWTILPEWAAELGALIITLEHRFFGLSYPSKASDPIEKYQSLTLENVMLDAVNFISHVKDTTSGAKESKVLVMGGSYGGFLTTVLKMNHPEVFYGALPFAAPLRSIGANYQNPQRYNWFKWVRNLGSYKYQRDADEVPAESSILGLVRQCGRQDETRVRGTRPALPCRYVQLNQSLTCPQLTRVLQQPIPRVSLRISASAPYQIRRRTSKRSWA